MPILADYLVKCGEHLNIWERNMKIDFNYKSKKLGDLEAGECFISDKRLFIKTMEQKGIDITCVALDSGALYSFEPEEKVHIEKVKVVKDEW